jgi:DnaJ like chaperone protein
MSVWKLLSGVAAGLASEIHLPGNGSISALLTSLSGRHPHADGGVAHNQIAFTIGVIALGAKMAKADGIVTRDEVLAFKDVFRVPEGELENVSRIFDLAKQDIAGYEVYAEQLAGLFKHDHRLLEDVLEGLFHIAMADGVFHPNEERFLAAVAKRFGISENEFSYIKARHVGSTKESPYDVLGVTPDISNDKLKTHYRRLVVENHPDKMVARGVPSECVSMATKKIAAINAAYEAVAKERHI